MEAFTANDSFMFAGTDYNGVWRRLRPGLVNIKPPSDVPKTFYLAQNYPNPFNLETVIKYSLPIQSKVTLKIYNVLGEEVRTLVDEVQTLGLRTINWNGQDNHGKPVSSGIYLYRIKAGVFTATKKMVLVE
ncbi:MAG: T9SS type A sorting domain-containing protein [Calditrichia bacterium]